MRAQYVKNWSEKKTNDTRALAKNILRVYTLNPLPLYTTNHI